MARGPERLTFGAIAGCVALITGAALGLLIYAALTFAGFLPTASAQAFSSLAY